MNSKNRQLTLIERWELDIESYKQGAKIKITISRQFTAG